MPFGHFYTQASPVPGAGYAILNGAGANFWDEFQRLGGVDVLGYPISNRYGDGGFVAQATQRAILQWQPDVGQVVLANVMDRLHDAGKDDALLATRQVPPPLDPAVDAGKPFADLVRGRQALLDPAPPLKAAYFAAPDPLARYGLPQSPPRDMGLVVVARTQRTALQLWKVDMPWARAGQVSLINAGEIARDAGLIPPDALAPQPPPAFPSAPPGSTHRWFATLDGPPVYFCDSDPAWKGAPPGQVIASDSEAVIRAIFPTYRPHAAC